MVFAPHRSHTLILYSPSTPFLETYHTPSQNWSSMACATQNKNAPSLCRLRHDTLAPLTAFDTQYSKGRTSLEQTKAPRSGEQNYGGISPKQTGCAPYFRQYAPIPPRLCCACRAKQGVDDADSKGLPECCTSSA